MKRGILLLAMMLGGIFAFGLSRNEWDSSSALEWFKSFWRRASLSGGDITGSNDVLETAASLVSNYEGFSARPYLDPPGNTNDTYSIFYGHQLTAGDGYTLDTVGTEEQGYAQLQSDLQVYFNCVTSVVDVSSLSVKSQAALISLCYNIGCSGFKKSSVVRLLAQGDTQGAAQAFLLWNKANGEINSTLVARRQDEMNVFLS